jgi:hypothetical protein
MFLFSTPSRPAPTQSEHPLALPLRQAADATGVSFDYLIKTAKRESNLNPEAKAANSSATGLFQFIEQTWLGLVKREGSKLGLGDAAESIQQDRSGRYVVPEADARAQILAMRKDPTLSARLAGVFTSENKSSLRDALGRDPSGGELYIAHFMGAGGARELISQASSNPDRSAASAFPDAASANRSIFFDSRGNARSVREVYARLVAFHDGANATMPAATVASTGAGEGSNDIPTRSPLAIAPSRDAASPGNATPANSAAAVNGFFRSGGNAQAASALRKTWISIAESRINPNAQSFFPREETVKVAAVTAEAVESLKEAATDLEKPRETPLAGFEAKMREDETKVTYEAVDAPLPPQRPASLSPNPLDLTRYNRARRR